MKLHLLLLFLHSTLQNTIDKYDKSSLLIYSPVPIATVDFNQYKTYPIRFIVTKNEQIAYLIDKSGIFVFDLTIKQAPIILKKFELIKKLKFVFLISNETHIMAIYLNYILVYEVTEGRLVQELPLYEQEGKSIIAHFYINKDCTFAVVNNY